MNNDKTVDELLLDFQTRLQGVANGLAARLATLISSTDVALLKTIVKNIPRAKAGKISIREEMKKLEKLVKKIEQIRAPGFDAARDFAFQVAIKTASATSANEAGIIDAQNAAASKKKPAKTLSDKTFDEIVRYEPIDGNSISKWLKNLQDKDLRDITQTVFRAASERVSVEEIARRIRGTKESNYTDGLLQTTRDGAAALSRTLINGVANNVRLETIRENADVIDGVRFVATLDGKTCPFCASYDGKIWSPAELDAVRRPPIHMNCRCCVVSRVDLRDKNGNVVEIGTRPAANADFDKLAEDAYNEKARRNGWKRRFADLSPSSRLKYYYEAQRDYEKRTGKPAYRQVDGRTTFKEYFEKQDDAFKRSWLGARRYELYARGALKLADVLKPAPSYRAKLSDLKAATANVDFIRVDGKLVDAVRESGEFLFDANRIERNVAAVSDDNFLEGFVEQKSVRKAAKFARDVLAVDADYSKIPLDVANATNRELIRARNMFGTCGVVNKIGCGDALFADGDFAGYDRKENKILLRSDCGTLRLATEIRRLHGESWFSTDSQNHVFRREIGHAILKYLEMSSSQEYNKRENAVREIIDGLKRIGDEKRLSYYGCSNPREAFAESIAAFLNGQSSIVAEKVVKKFLG